MILDSPVNRRKRNIMRRLWAMLRRQRLLAKEKRWFQRLNWCASANNDDDVDIGTAVEEPCSSADVLPSTSDTGNGFIKVFSFSFSLKRCLVEEFLVFLNRKKMLLMYSRTAVHQQLRLFNLTYLEA